MPPAMQDRSFLEAEDEKSALHGGCTIPGAEESFEQFPCRNNCGDEGIPSEPPSLAPAPDRVMDSNDDDDDSFCSAQSSPRESFCGDETTMNDDVVTKRESFCVEETTIVDDVVNKRGSLCVDETTRIEDVVTKTEAFCVEEATRIDDVATKTEAFCIEETTKFDGGVNKTEAFCVEKTQIDDVLSKTDSVCVEETQIDDVVTKNGRTFFQELEEGHAPQECGRVLKSLDLFRSLEAEGSTSADFRRSMESTKIDIERLNAEKVQGETVLKEMYNEEGYRISMEDKDSKMLYKQEGRIHCFIIELTLEASLKECVALAWEFDLIKTWNRFVSDTVKLHEEKCFRMWAYAGVWLPWPIPDRQLTVFSKGLDFLEEHDCMVFLVESTETLPVGARALPKGAKDRVTIDVLQPSGGALFPLGPKLTRGRLLFYVDPHIPTVPEWLVNFVLGKMIPWVLRIIVKYMNPKGEFHRSGYVTQMAANPPFYNHLQQRHDEKVAQLKRRTNS
mmetsp:Transcript_12054/g.20385  ORF Transcript_12054/g.20385 Transcript_12054/m.20385 type:complete len:504 (+) Transcript_12054:132-1643(+)